MIEQKIEKADLLLSQTKNTILDGSVDGSSNP